MNPQNNQPSNSPEQNQPIVEGPTPPSPIPGDPNAKQPAEQQATATDIGANQSASPAVFSNTQAQNIGLSPNPEKRSLKSLVAIVVIVIILVVGGISAALLNQKGVEDVDNPSANQSSFDSDFEDRQREVDIQAIKQELEGYYVENGVYPLFSQMNDKNWVSTNLPDLEVSAFDDPAGSSTQLSETPNTHVYAYQPTGCTDEFCTAFTLTATLNDGTTFSRTSRGDSGE